MQTVLRFVLTLINKKTIKPEHFVKKENGAVLMNDTGRKTMISAWQGRKRDKIKHPFLGDKIEWVSYLMFRRYC